jgi:hypothetical protein
MSKFDRLFKVAKSEVDETEPANLSYPVAVDVGKRVNKANSTVKLAKPSGKDTAGADKVSGKRQHPDFVGLTTYVRKDVHRRVKIALLVEGANRELSELVDELLADWLKGKSA